MLQDSWVHEAVDCDYIKREVAIYTFTHQGKGYLLMKCANLFAIAFPFWGFEWLHCSSGTTFPMTSQETARPWTAP